MTVSFPVSTRFPAGDPTFAEMRNIFAVMDSDPATATAWNETAYEHILDYQRNPDYNNLANAGAMLGVVDSAAVQEMEARGANNLDNQKAIYDMKKAALGAALGWPASQMPGGVGDTLTDLTIKGMIGAEPTLESVQSNVSTTTRWRCDEPDELLHRRRPGAQRS